jgi:hypothetical protein
LPFAVRRRCGGFGVSRFSVRREVGNVGGPLIGAETMVRRIALRNVAVGVIAAFVIYGEYLVWIKSPMSQIVAICDDFRALKEAIAAQRSREPFSVINEASAASLEPVRLIGKAVRACDGLPEAVDVEESNPR